MMNRLKNLYLGLLLVVAAWIVERVMVRVKKEKVMTDFFDLSRSFDIILRVSHDRFTMFGGKTPKSQSHNEEMRSVRMVREQMEPEKEIKH